jgi:hypothetical protein
MNRLCVFCAIPRGPGGEDPDPTRSRGVVHNVMPYCRFYKTFTKQTAAIQHTSTNMFTVLAQATAYATSAPT